MSVIAWDGRTMAADKRACLGTLIRTTTKICRVGEGAGEALCAYAGDAAGGEELLAWFRDGAKPADFPASQRDRENWSGLLVVKRTGVFKYEYSPYPVRFNDKFFAIGSGRDFALATMHLGYDARTAVEVAIALDSGCGNGVDTLAFDA
jgi:ATP-dependent protease HslVU (ClpYQ) peptidase subunit